MPPKKTRISALGTRGGLPGLHVEFPKALRPAGCGIGKIERGRARPGHAVRTQRQLLEKVDVGIHVALVAGKTSGEQTFLQMRGTRDAQRRRWLRRPQQRRSTAFLRSEEFVANRIVDHAAYDFAVLILRQSWRAMFETERHIEEWG